ncbi:glycosaminoglycan xylosylkinase-like isoform X2 [Penaeus monodon]|uniref:glycosaminoglycan xylosylkinase-like isoform X2 n=1 Tax=Penaeus monodon TaxID=6687 RepID=UPI0018A7E0CD|nr:glycosaminoglycan xylosylkinase-like isoform X2 [Penaeus monodon]
MHRFLKYVFRLLTLATLLYLCRVGKFLDLYVDANNRSLLAAGERNQGELPGRVFHQGQLYALRKIQLSTKERQNRPGLRMLSRLYAHRPAVEAKYSSTAPDLMPFVETLKQDLTVKGVTKDPWALAREWASSKSLVPKSAPGLGDILAAMTTAPITAADICNAGTQVKILLKLQGDQKVLFKPISYPPTKVLFGKNRGSDRHYGEIAAFYLGRLLGLETLPAVVGRKILLTEEVIPVSSPKLAETFYTNEQNKTCLHARCRRCKSGRISCSREGDLMEGAVIMWLPEHLRVSEKSYVWQHYYKRKELLQWETDENFCKVVLHSDQGKIILDLIDMSVLDFLIQNADRHHYLQDTRDPNASIILVDQGKRIRAATRARLVLLSGGGLSRALRELLGLDPLAPVLADAHLRALDRRLAHVLAALSACSEKKGGWHNVLF